MTSLWVVIVPLTVLCLTTSIVIAPLCVEVRVSDSRSEGSNRPNDMAVNITVVQQSCGTVSEFNYTYADLHNIIKRVTRNIFDYGEAKKDDYGEILRTAKLTRCLVREYINGRISDRIRYVREISNLQDLVNEIHYFGRKGPQTGELREYEYYLFGQLVLRMSTDNFYINGDAGGYMGVLLRKSFDTGTHCQMVPSKIESEALKLTLEAMKKLLAGTTYQDMRDVCDSFFHVMRMYMFGEGNDIEMSRDSDLEMISTL